MIALVKNKELKMAILNVQDVAVTLESVSDEAVSIRIGGEAQQVTKDQLQQLMNGGFDQWQHLIQNIAIRLRLLNAKVADDIELKREMERVTFKMMR
jgi:hypothetical protein